MPTMMHAAIVEAFGAPLALQTRPVPQVEPGQILVNTDACGVCHIYLHAARGDLPIKPLPPFMPGHEAMGIVVALGAGVTVRGSFVGTREDMAVALAFAASSKVQPDIELQALSAINAVLDRLERGQVPPRVVLDFGNPI